MSNPASGSGAAYGWTHEKQSSFAVPPEDKVLGTDEPIYGLSRTAGPSLKTEGIAD